MKDILSEIIAHKRSEIAAQKKSIPYSLLERELADCHSPVYSLKDALLQSGTGIIAEFKRRSPSRGWINQHANAENVTKGYEPA